MPLRGVPGLQRRRGVRQSYGAVLPGPVLRGRRARVRRSPYNCQPRPAACVPRAVGRPPAAHPLLLPAPSAPARQTLDGPHPCPRSRSRRFLVIELFQPYANDANPTLKGVAVRHMGSLANCTSTHAAPTHAAPDTPGGLAYLLSTPDPAGAAPGSRFEDGLRSVSVVLESWSRARAVVRVRA